MKKFIFGLIVGLLLPVIAGYFYIKGGMMPVATASAPLPMEEKIARMALGARMHKEMPKDSPVPADETNMTQGAHIYLENCAFCHGYPDQPASNAAKGMFPLDFLFECAHLLPQQHRESAIRHSRLVDVWRREDADRPRHRRTGISGAAIEVERESSVVVSVTLHQRAKGEFNYIF